MVNNTRKYKYKKTAALSAIVSAAIFAVIIVISVLVLAGISSGSSKRQKEILSNAIQRTVAVCYAIEGRYPESLDYMKKYYNLTYDESSFYVDYVIYGENIYPDITILDITK